MIIYAIIHNLPMLIEKGTLEANEGMSFERLHRV